VVVASLAVFQSTSAFNSDVSNWNVSAVTDMDYSKCTLSLSVATAPSVVVCCWIFTLTRVSSDHNSHTCCSFFVLCI